ncbi:uncharacterized protein ACR2FA_005799 [Aphomia sociella]
MDIDVSSVALANDETIILSSAQTPSSIYNREKKFICAYRNLPILWNTKHPDYSYKHKRKVALHQLLGVYKLTKPTATIFDVRMKINTLRSNYRRELKRVVLSKATADSPLDIYKPKSWSFELLNFLNADIEYSGGTNDNDECDNQEQIKEDIDEEDLSQAQTGETSYEIIPTYIPPKKKHSSNNKKRMKLEKKDTTENTNCSTSDALNTTNPVALIWAEKLNRLQPEQRLFAEKAINDVLFEAELGNLNRYSVKINEDKGKCSPTYAECFVSTHMPSFVPDNGRPKTRSSSLDNDNVDNVVIKQEKFMLSDIVTLMVDSLGKRGMKINVSKMKIIVVERDSKVSK